MNSTIEICQKLLDFILSRVLCDSNKQVLVGHLSVSLSVCPYVTISLSRHFSIFFKKVGSSEMQAKKALLEFLYLGLNRAHTTRTAEHYSNAMSFVDFLAIIMSG